MSVAVNGLSRRYGGLAAVEAVSFTARAAEVTAVIGPNGAGKTTLLNLMSGVVRPDRGSVAVCGRDVTGAPPHVLAAHGVTRTYQSPQLFGSMTVLETVMVGAHRAGRAGFLAAMARFGAREESRMEAMALRALRRAGLPEGCLERSACDLAYGLQRRVEIARALASTPTVILLDEPAAGLNASETAELSDLIGGLASDGLTVLLVEHDMEMVMGLSHHVVVMNFGQKIAEGRPEAVQADQAVIEAYLGIEEDAPHACVA